MEGATLRPNEQHHTAANTSFSSFSSSSSSSSLIEGQGDTEKVGSKRSRSASLLLDFGKMALYPNAKKLRTESGLSSVSYESADATESAPIANAVTTADTETTATLGAGNVYENRHLEKKKGEEEEGKIDKKSQEIEPTKDESEEVASTATTSPVVEGQEKDGESYLAIVLFYGVLFRSSEKRTRTLRKSFYCRNKHAAECVIGTFWRVARSRRTGEGGIRVVPDMSYYWNLFEKYVKKVDFSEQSQTEFKTTFGYNGDHDSIGDLEDNEPYVHIPWAFDEGAYTLDLGLITKTDASECFSVND